MTVSLDRFTHYKVGSDRFDADHWEILSAIACIATSSCKEHAAYCVDLVQQLWFEHSIAEENEMARVNYPYLEDHLKEHIKLIASFDELRAKIARDNKMTTNIYCTDLEVLILNHIDHHDQQISSFIRKMK